MAKTLSHPNKIAEQYYKLLFSTADGKVYYTNSSDQVDTEAVISTIDSGSTSLTIDQSGTALASGMYIQATGSNMPNYRLIPSTKTLGGSDTKLEFTLYAANQGIYEVKAWDTTNNKCAWGVFQLLTSGNVNALTTGTTTWAIAGQTAGSRKIIISSIDNSAVVRYYFTGPLPPSTVTVTS